MVPAVKRVGADLLDFAAPGIAEFISGGKNFKTAAKSVGRQVTGKQLGTDSKKRVQEEPFQQTVQNKKIGREETILQTSLNFHFEQFSVPTFYGSSCNSWRESPSS